MKAILFILIFTSSLFAININDSLLKVHATLIPKMYLMDYKCDEKIIDNSIIIYIVYQRNEYKKAILLKKNIDTKYKNKIQSYKIKTKLVTYAKVNKTRGNIYYLFPSSKSNIKKVIKQANIYDALTFSYLNDDLQYGVMVSLNVDKKIKPILNLKAIKKNNIELRPILLDISILYNKAIDSSLNNLMIKNMLNLNIYYQV